MPVAREEAVFSVDSAVDLAVGSAVDSEVEAHVEIVYSVDP